MEKSWNCVFEFLWEPCKKLSAVRKCLRKVLLFYVKQLVLLTMVYALSCL